MCTVSYIPQETGYVLTVNRDESPDRDTIPPRSEKTGNGKSMVAPRDGLKGGTWVALDENGRSVCLLNGAFKRHSRKLPYRRSRGHYVTEAIEATDFESFLAGCDLTGIEPFTMLLITRDSIHKLVWDGTRKYNWELASATHHLWSSPTLYSPREHAYKEKFFKDEISSYDSKPSTILKIHGVNQATPFILDRPGVRTVSITQVSVSETVASLQYHSKTNPNEKASLISNTVLPCLQGAGTAPTH